MQTQIQRGEMGPWFNTTPGCKVDLVLIDSTRFAHVGILATILLANGLTDASTGFLIENDHWGPNGEWAGKGRNELKILSKYWDMDVEFEENPDGEMWPWALLFIKKWV